MPRSKITRAQRARLRQLADRLERITQADFDYFAGFPTTGTGFASPGSLRSSWPGGDMSLPPGSQRYVAVRFLMPSTRSRMLIVGPADAGPELTSERAARRIFEHCETELARNIQAGLLKAGPK
jgi:hypothetical protein